jgi:hypothetical protein
MSDPEFDRMFRIVGYALLALAGAGQGLKLPPGRKER